MVADGIREMLFDRGDRARSPRAFRECQMMPQRGAGAIIGRQSRRSEGAGAGLGYLRVGPGAPRQRLRIDGGQCCGTAPRESWATDMGGYQMTQVRPFLLALVLIGAAGPLAAQDAMTSDEMGAQLYADNCAACHGMKGQGDGPLAEAFIQDIPALTGLSAANDGTFPLLKVIQILDGRTEVRGHGGPMPVFGALFRNELEPLVGRFGTEAVIRGRVLAIAEHVATLQE